MKVYRPVTAPRPQGPASRRSHETGRRAITVLDGRMDPPLIDGLVAGLRSRLTDIEIKTHAKPSGTNPSPRHVIDDVAAWSEVVIVGTGM